jgi:hypothetical protein
MNRVDILNILNQYAIDGDEKLIVKTVNFILDSGEINQNKELLFKFISSTQFYGFLEYFPQNIREEFLKFDFFTSSSYRGSKLSYYNSGQLSLLYEMIQNRKVFISAPTSFGKTSLITEMILESESEFDNILMIIPTNSLIEELFMKFNSVNHEYELGYRISTQPLYSHDCNNILLLTPERFLVIMESISVDDFDLIIMDETYKIVDFNNQIVSDFINRRSYRFRKVADLIGYSKAKVLYLSPYTYNLKDSMIKFLEKYDIKRINRKIDYVTHKIIKMENSEDFQSYFCERGYQKKFSISKQVSRIISVLNNEETIVDVSSYSKAYEIVGELPPANVEGDDRYNKFIEHMKENYSIDNIPRWKVVEGLEKGVGIYISPLPRYIKKEIVNLYDRGILKTLIVTTAFTEGINTDAEHLIITSLISGSNKNKLTELDLLNTVGRAGRFTKRSVGKVYCLTDEIYRKVIDVKTENQVDLENLNYIEKSTGRRNDYELDMMGDEYLNELELEKKYNLDKKIKELGLTKKDLNISLNVSNRWKVYLYEFLQSLSDKEHILVEGYVRSIVEDNGDKLKGIEHIFKVINYVISKKSLVPFPFEIYEIKPFDNKGGFTWGRMYRIYSSHSTKTMIKRNIEYITKRINDIIKEYPVAQNYESFKLIARNRGETWLLSYINRDFEIRYNKFFTETFKFISSVIQYRIPYYMTYYLSVYKLFLLKNDMSKDLVNSMDLNKIVTLFENNNYGDEYSVLVDYGISNDILTKLRDNEISIDMLDELDSMDILDNFEKLVIKDVLAFIER